MSCITSIALLLLAVALAAPPATGEAAAPPMPPTPSTAVARRYHDQTKHTTESVWSSRHRLDWANKPTLYRTYDGAETIPLPRRAPLPQPALAVLAGDAAAAGGAVDLRALAAMLFAAAGIIGERPRGGELRATAAAGALYPNELYVVTGPLPDLPAGVYHYDPKHERLSRLRAGDWRAALAGAAADERVRAAPATLVVTGLLWRTAWKYQERGYRHLYWDGGMQLAHALAAATASGLPAQLIASFVDQRVDDLLGADGRREMSLALLTIGAPAAPASPPPAAPPPPLPYAATPLSPRPLDYPEGLAYHAASRLASADAVTQTRAAAFAPAPPPLPSGPMVDLPPPLAPDARMSLDQAILRRRSTRRFARRPITAAQLATILDLSARGVAADYRRAAPLIETYVIVHAVDGVAPGAYRWRQAPRELELLRAGDFRAAAGALCLGQELARDASAVLFYLSPLDPIIAAFGERGYRLAELDAGVIAGRAYLATYALGRGATGLTFYDDEVTGFFSPSAAGREPLLVVAVGVPARRD